MKKYEGHETESCRQRLVDAFITFPFKKIHQKLN